MKSPAEIIADTVLSRLRSLDDNGFSIWWGSLSQDSKDHIHGKLVTDVAAIVPTYDEWQTIDNLAQAAASRRTGCAFLPLDDAQVDAVTTIAKRAIGVCRKATT